MATPTFFTVEADYKSVVGDSDTDLDADPQLGPVTATVTFTPMIKDGDVILATTMTPRPTGFVAAPIPARIDTDGRLKVRVDPDKDVLPFANLAAFPGTGNTAKLYLAQDTQIAYYWSGSAYVVTDNYVPVRLLADTVLLELDGDLWYTVSFTNVQYNGKKGQINSFAFQAPNTDTVINLITVTPGPGQQASGITKIAPGGARRVGNTIVFTFAGVDIPDPIDISDLSGEAWADIPGKPAPLVAGPNVANGYAGLDGSGKIGTAQLPISAMEYKGNWNVSTNSPTLADGTGSAGDVYKVATGAARNLGSGSITWDIGDYAIYNGSTWEKSDTTDDVAIIASGTHAATSKTTPVDADELPLSDSAASFGLKKLTWANAKATLKTYFDTLYQPVAAKLTALAGQTWAADTLTYQTSTSALSTTPLTAAGRALIDDADAAAQRATLGLDHTVAVVIYSGSLTTARPTADVVIWSGFPSTPTNALAQDIVEQFPASFITSTGGTTTLTSTSAPRQVVTGSAYEQIVLPTTGVKAGDAFEVDCETSGSVDISPSGGGTIVTLQQSETGQVVALIDTPTTTAHWSYRLLSVFHTSLGSADFTVVVRSTGGAVAVGSIELGHASDTTITRVSAGNIAVEGNAIYRAGGTDVPITDGGTGVSTLPAGLLKGAGTGAITAATAGTDYTSPSSTETQTNKTLTNPTITNYTESVVPIGNTGTAKTLSLTNGTMQTATLTGNCTFTMPPAVAGKSFSLALATGAGGFTATFTGAKWAGGVAPTVTAAASKTDVFSFTCFDGSNWIGSVIQAVA